jgi:hypothetical protein
MGGHGGLNILPQKTWNVYRRDNRDKVDEDEQLLNEAKRKRAQNQKSQDLQTKLGSLKNHKSSAYALPAHGNLDDQELFKQAKKDKKREEKEKQKEIQEMLKDPKMTGQDGHLNLFLAEEYEMHEKEKSKGDDKNMYLKRTANLGEFFENNSKPWYINKNKQLKRYEDIRKEEEKDYINKNQTKAMLRIARKNPTKEFGQVLKLENSNSHSSDKSDMKHKKEKSRKEKRRKSHKKEKKSKKHKKEKKLKEIREEKLKEICALIEYCQQDKD